MIDSKKYISDLVALVNPAILPMWNLKTSRDALIDFSNFTKLQGGGKSNDINDTAAKFMPPKADKDGQFYHTVNDITWMAFKNHIPNATAERFYDMNEKDRALIISHFLVNPTNCIAVDMLLSYIKWGSGSFLSDAVFFKEMYGYDLYDAVKKNPFDAFDNLTVARLEHIKKFKTFSKHGKGWQRGHLCFYKLFRQYA